MMPATARRGSGRVTRGLTYSIFVAAGAAACAVTGIMRNSCVNPAERQRKGRRGGVMRGSALTTKPVGAGRNSYGKQAARCLATLAALPLLAQTSEFIADPMPTPSCHASTIVELAPGELMSAWFGGAAEGRPDVAIWGARYEKGRWRAPVELAREADTPTWNPVLFHTPDGVLWLYYKFGTSPREWTAARMFSSDRGRTWSKPEHLPAGIYGPIRARPLVLASGLIVSGTSVESYHSWAGWIERSTDNGKSWTRHGPIMPPEGGIIQPSVVQVEGDHLRLYARPDKAGRICVSDSHDGGITWTPARLTELPNPNSGIDVIRLKDGRYLAVYNHTPRGRTPLNLAISADGDHWTPLQTLESDPGEYSYPSMIQAADGTVHITYTWRRQKIKHVALRVP